ncbi:MAG TPA: response regulator [Candidatus Binataceae bacterium]|nr:response regulator [Candidatus Binataceae bacterium]
MSIVAPASQASVFTVMVVDDQHETLTSTRMLLEHEGYRVLTAASGAAALATLREERAQLLLIDYFMPRMNGEQLVEAIRQFDRDVQIILQTGYYGEKPPREMMRLLDVQGYHDKTDGPDRLLLGIETALKSARQLARVKGAEAELVESQAELRRLSMRLLELQEEERERISRELHDELGQLLTAIALDLDWSSRHCPSTLPALAARLAESRALIEDAIRGTRELCSSLRVDEWHERGLAAAVRACVREFEKRCSMAVSFAASLEDEEFEAEVVRNVCRIVQEALNNVGRHAQAAKVAIELSRTAEHLALSVADDGIGFDTGKKSDPLASGLIGMRERARLIGGQLTLRSVPGAGTRIELTLRAGARVAR